MQWMYMHGKEDHRPSHYFYDQAGRACMHVCIHVSMHACMYECIHTCMYVCPEDAASGVTVLGKRFTCYVIYAWFQGDLGS